MMTGIAEVILLKKTWVAGKRTPLFLLLNLLLTPCFFDCASPVYASADKKAADIDIREGKEEAPANNHTPLAGEPGHASFMGKTITIPEQDRGRLTCITLGAYCYPKKDVPPVCRLEHSILGGFGKIHAPVT